VSGETVTNFAVTTAFEANWVSTLRGRFGWAITPTTLIYATGGVALTELKMSNAFVDDAIAMLAATVNTSGSSSASRIIAGLTVGGGVEWALFANWTLKAEYLYLDFGSVSTTALVINSNLAPANPNLLRTSADLKAQLARF